MRIVGDSIVTGGTSRRRGIGRLSAALAALFTAVLLGAAPGGAEISSTPSWLLETNGEVNDAVQVGDAVYLGGQFSYVGPRTGPLVALSRTTGEKLDLLPEVVNLFGYLGLRQRDRS